MSDNIRRPLQAISLYMEDEDSCDQDQSECLCESHISHRTSLSINEFNQIIDSKSNALNGVESIDFMNTIITYDILRSVIDNCPNIQCIKLNQAKFETYSVVSDHLFPRIGPKLKHLSSNDSLKEVRYKKDQDRSIKQLIEKKSLQDLLKYCTALTDICTTITSDNEFDVCFLENCKKLIYFYLNDQAEKNFEYEGDYVHPLDNNMKHLKELNNNVKYIRLKTCDGLSTAAIPALAYIARIPSVRVLNLSIGNAIDLRGDSSFYYREIFQLPLKSLTIEILPSDNELDFKQNNTTEIIKLTINSRVKNTLKRLQLIGAEIELKAIEILESFENLYSLQFNDCVFELINMDKIVNKLEQMRQISEFHFRIIFTEDYQNSDFHSMSMYNLRQIINNNINIRKIFVESNIPEKFNSLIDVAKSNDIEFILDPL